MPFLLTFALKNLGRHLRRTLITASALAVGLATFLLVDSLLKGADNESERNLIWYAYGGARVATPEAAAEPDKLSLKHPLLEPSAVAALVRAQGFPASPRLTFEAELVAPGAEAPVSRLVKAVGVDPATDGDVFPRKELKLTGRWCAPGEAAVVLGVWLAEDLGVTVGQSLTLTTRTREGSFQVLDLEVVGLVNAPDPAMNRYGVYLPLDQAQLQLGMPGQATEVAVGLAPGSDAAASARQLQSALVDDGQPVRVLSWRDLAQDFLALTVAKQKSSSVILFLVFVIAAVGVGNTLLLAFYERKTEIGMLRALGMADRQLFQVFLAEAAGIGVIGSALGLLLGAGFVSLLVSVGIDFSFLIRQMDIGYRIAGVLYGTWSPGTFAAAGILGVVLAVVCAVGPTRRALRLPITESLRAEG
jgi:ABC-type lipoprotein release transport system permease subunit